MAVETHSRTFGFDTVMTDHSDRLFGMGGQLKTESPFSVRRGLARDLVPGAIPATVDLAAVEKYRRTLAQDAGIIYSSDEALAQFGNRFLKPVSQPNPVQQRVGPGRMSI